MTDQPDGQAPFDGPAFFAALDSERTARGLTWKQVASESGVSASTLTRMSQGKRPDVDGLASLLSWAGLEASAFIRTNTPASSPATLTRISTELRADPLLSDESATALEDIIRTAYRQLAGRDVGRRLSRPPAAIVPMTREQVQTGSRADHAPG